MAKAALDTRNILTGKDGELYDDLGNFLAAVNTFNAQVSINNTGYTPAGELLEVAILSGYSVTLGFTETVVEDAALLQKLVVSLKEKNQMYANFQGVVRGKNGQEQRLVFRMCVPDGTIDLQKIQPGEIINREWNWRVNEAPDLQSLLTA